MPGKFCGHKSKKLLQKKLQKKKFPRTVVKEIDIAFPVVHGTNVEDGVLQGYLQTIGVPYVGSNVYASVVGQDKIFMKQIFESEKKKKKKYVWFYDNDYKLDAESVLKKVNTLTYPVIVKPANLGSSVGITVVKTEENLDKAIKCVKDFIREKGYRDVYLSNNYLKDINLTLDQIKSFKKLNIEE